MSGGLSLVQFALAQSCGATPSAYGSSSRIDNLNTSRGHFRGTPWAQETIKR